MHQYPTHIHEVSSNKLFWGYDGIEGGKTGYNKKEQQTTIISTTSRGNMKLICVILDSLENTMYTEISQNDISYVHPLGESYIKEFNATADLKPPIKKTIPAGSARYILQDGTAVNISLYPETEIIPPEDFLSTARKKILDNKDIFLLVLFLIVIEVILIVFNIGKLLKKLVLMLAKRFKRHRRSE